MAAVSEEPAATDGAIEQWRVRAGGAGGVARWEEVLAATHVAFEVRLPGGDSEAFLGSVRRRGLGRLSLVECASTPWSGWRGGPVLGSAGQDNIGLQMVRRGAERVVRPGGSQRVLTAGAVALWDGAQPVGVEVMEPFAKRTLIFPRDLAQSVSPRLADVEALGSIADRPATRLLVRYVDALAAELPGLDGRTREAAADVVLELLRAAVEPELPEPRAARREAMRVRVRRYVRANLADPGLGPESIARALAISVRTLHAVFEDSDESVAALVRRYRLARCREDLSDPAGGSVTEIAYRWGFSNPAHFSHVFKREYGVSPRDLRRATLADPR